MPHVSAMLVAASAFVVLFLGSVHLLYTFRGTRLHPRDAAVRTAMEHGAPRLTPLTTMWRAWVGFNASHSYGAMLFGLIYGYLALVQPAVLFQSMFLKGLGVLALAAYLHLGVRYWFRIPLTGIALAAVLYVLGLLLAV